MVQIRRTPTMAKKQSFAKQCQTKGIRCLRYVAISAVIPAVFVLRFHYFGNNSGSKIGGGGGAAGRVRIRSSITSAPTVNGNDDATVAQQRRFQSYINFLESVDYSVEHNLHGSDVVELHHCNVKAVHNWTDFMVAADPLLQGAIEALKQPLLEAVDQEEITAAAADAIKDMQEEFLLELLEQYVSTQHGLCDYAKYRPSVVGHAREGNKLIQAEQLRQEKKHDNDLRLAIVISAFHDVDQLVALIEAVHQPQHYIVIHLERHAPVEYRAQVEALLLGTTTAQNHENVVIVQFGTVVYRTDSLSMINLRILRWLTIDLNLGYVHVVLMDGSAFALQSAS